MKLRSITAAAGAAFALALAAPAARADEDGPSYLTLGVGYFDVNKQDDDGADFRLEYRHGEGIWLIKPWAGVEATSDGAVYGVAGFLVDLVVGDNFVITPSIGVGAYSDGDGKDLGHTVEFRSQIEVRLPVRLRRAPDRRLQPYLERRARRRKPGGQYRQHLLFGSARAPDGRIIPTSERTGSFVCEAASATARRRGCGEAPIM